MNVIYLILNLLLLASIAWIVYKQKLSQPKTVLFSGVIVGVIFYLWNIVFFKLLYWGVNWNMTIGLELLDVPVEEILYYILLAILIGFLEDWFTSQFSDFKLRDSFRNLYLVLLLVALLLVINFRANNITFFTALFCSICLSYLWISGSNRLITDVFLISVVGFMPYILLSWIRFSPLLGEPLIWYHSNQTSEIRLGNIPIEVCFKWFILVFLTLWIKSRLKNSL